MLSRIVQAFMLRQAGAVRASLADPRAAQVAVFRRLKSSLSQTKVSVFSGFERCTALEDMRGIEILDSDSLLPLLHEAFERDSRDAEAPLFGHSKLRGFGRTSGTEGEPKHLPIHDDYLASCDRSLFRMISCCLAETGQWEFAWSGKRILLGSRPRVGTSPAGLPLYDVSGYLMTRSPLFSRSLYLPRREDLWIDDWEDKSERILEQALKRNVVSISGIPALTFDFCERARKKFGVRTLHELWPNLSIYIFGGAPLPPTQRAELSRIWFGDDRELPCLETLFATEGPIAFSLGPSAGALALNLLENLYLFEDVQDGSIFFPEEIKIGRTYSLILSTPGGLIQYRIRDRVEVLSEKPLLVRFSGRDREEISLTGEKITLAQVDAALCESGYSELTSAILWIEPGIRPRLAWGIPEDQVANVSPDRLDESLCRLNVLYAEALLKEKVIGGSTIVGLSQDRFVATPERRKLKRLFSSREELEAARRR